MEATIDNALSPIEEILIQIPGGATPMGRMALFGGMGAAYAYTMRPSMSFDASGNAKPWIVFDPQNPNAAIFPYWAWGVVPAIIFGVLV